MRISDWSSDVCSSDLLASLARIALGPDAQPFVSEALDEDYQGAPIGPDYAAGIAAHYFNESKLSIFAGSNEVQREIITKVSIELCPWTFSIVRNGRCQPKRPVAIPRSAPRLRSSTINAELRQNGRASVMENGGIEG